MSDDMDWFAPKRFGYGAGLPIAWQGWALSAAYVGIIVAATPFLPGRPLPFVAVVIPATALFMLICARTTRGGWRWRWRSRRGSDD